jgi:hypothetical protein
MEAHASDEWPLGPKRSCFAQHKTSEERRIAAQYYRKVRMSADQCAANKNILAASEADFACDSMHNIFYKTFGAWPEGHLVINTDNQLVVSTVAVHGSGEIKDGPWWRVIERALVEELDLVQKNCVV